MLAHTRALLECQEHWEAQGIRFDGKVVYPLGHEIDIPASAVDRAFYRQPHGADWPPRRQHPGPEGSERPRVRLLRNHPAVPGLPGATPGRRAERGGDRGLLGAFRSLAERLRKRLHPARTKTLAKCPSTAPPPRIWRPALLMAYKAPTSKGFPSRNAPCRLATSRETGQTACLSAFYTSLGL